MQSSHHETDHEIGLMLIPMTSLAHAEKVLNEHDALILYFTAPGCNVCQAVKPRIIELAEKYRVPVLLSSIDEHVEFSAQRLVFTIPTVLIMYQGREIGRESRFIDFDQLERTISLMTD